MRVPMRSTGADHPVVVKKFLCNENGAKGMSQLIETASQPGNWEELNFSM